MKIALDYENVFILDISFWEKFIDLAKFHGHSVIGICENENFGYKSKEPKETMGKLVPLVFANGLNKKRAMFKAGHDIDIWIDFYSDFLDSFSSYNIPPEKKK